MKGKGLKKLRIKEYTLEMSEGRCWGCCQENCGFESYCSCSCHKTWTVTRYKIVKGSQTLDSGFKTKPNLEKWIKENLNIEKIRKPFTNDKRLTEREFKQRMAEINKAEKKAIDWIKKVREI